MPTPIVTIEALSKSNSIHNLKITYLCGHLLFDSSEEPALLAGVDDADDKDTFPLQKYMMKTLPLQKCMTKTLLLQECMMKTLLLQECLYPTLPS